MKHNRHTWYNDIMKKILIIEDEPSIRELVSYNLQTNGYEALEAEDGTQGLAKARSEGPDLIILDIMLPGIDGYEICRTLRGEGNNTPIIMLTAKSEEVDKVLGLEFGADDYIAKPFGIRELLARIKAVLRRYENGGDKETGSAEDVITIGDLTINFDRHEVIEDGEAVELTYREFELLGFLMRNEGHVFTRDELLDKVWGIEYAGETRTVDVHVRYLRRKLHDDDEKYIETIRGKGYKFK